MFAGSRSVQVFDLVDDFEKLLRRLRAQIYLGGAAAKWMGMPQTSLSPCPLRHTHASQLIHTGVDIVTISKRLGYAKLSETLAIYAHMFTTDDRKVAAAIDTALRIS